MFEQEKIIDGVLCVRFSPEGKFLPYASMGYTTMIVNLRDQIIRIDYLATEILTKTMGSGEKEAE